VRAAVEQFQRGWRARHPRPPLLVDSDVVPGFAFPAGAVAARYRAKVTISFRRPGPCVDTAMNEPSLRGIVNSNSNSITYYSKSKKR